MRNVSLISKILMSLLAVWALTPALQSNRVMLAHSTSLSSEASDVASSDTATEAEDTNLIPDGSLIEQSLEWGDDCPANGDFQSQIDEEEKSITCKVNYTAEGGRKISGQVTVARSGSLIQVTPEFKGCKDSSKKTREFRDITQTNSRAKEYTMQQVQFCMMAEGTVLESEPDAFSILGVGKVSLARMAAVISCRQTLTGKAIPEADRPECYKQFSKYLPSQVGKTGDKYVDNFLLNHPTSVPQLRLNDLHLLDYRSNK